MIPLGFAELPPFPVHGKISEITMEIAGERSRYTVKGEAATIGRTIALAFRCSVIVINSIVYEMLVAGTAAGRRLAWQPLYRCLRRHGSSAGGGNSDTAIESALRASIAKQDARGAARAYGEARGAWLAREGGGSGALQQSDLRALHVLLRRAAGAAGLAGEQRRAMLTVAVQAIADMRRLRLRVGATEIAALVYAHTQLGQHARAVDEWRAGVARRAGGDQADCLIRIFPLTHQHALAAAVALKAPRTVRDVYTEAMRGELPSPAAAFFWTLFPVQTASGGADRAWDAARLGAAFLEQVRGDAERLAARDGRLAARIAQAELRALFLEGRPRDALRLYERLRAGGSGAARVVSEVVGGLCRHALVDDAFRVLEAAAECCTVHAWNAFLDGLGNSMRRGAGGGRAPGAVLTRMQQSMAAMERSRDARPDAATRAIWLRACFRAGEWRRALAYFSAHADAMRGDVVCWDVAVRGLFATPDVAAQREGWRLVRCLVAVRAPVVADARLADTVLLHVFPRLRRTLYAPPALVADAQTLDAAVAWLEAHMHADRKTTRAIVIGALLAAGQTARALDAYRAMKASALWPTRAVNCMVAAAHPTLESAMAFIAEHCPPHHYAAAFAAVLAPALQRRCYEDVWMIMDRHYPEVRVDYPARKAGDPLSANIGGGGEVPPPVAVPYPSAAMYAAVLAAARAHGDGDECGG
ncbi:hypothetical protein GGI02_002103 [Coemansia sp. RSA 2322]|nr:hypothetical protein GGI02_002103 [Coemansia sp. RSA 2322]